MYAKLARSVSQSGEMSIVARVLLLAVAAVVESHRCMAIELAEGREGGRRGGAEAATAAAARVTVIEAATVATVAVGAC